jgi:hypothetical protein
VDWKVAKRSDEVSIEFDFLAENSKKGGFDVKRRLEVEF